MTETDWLACSNPQRMLAMIPYRVSKRKWRLLAVAFCRRIWHLFSDHRSREAVEAAERWADGLIGLKELKRARTEAEPYRLGLVGVETQDAPFAAFAAAIPSKQATANAASCARAAAAHARAAVHLGGGSVQDEEKHQCDLIRDILGYPYRLVTPDPAWLRWNDGAVVKIARAIYDGRRFEDLPILADALLDAGCDSEDILSHCRSPGPHALGCWVVDLLLGKQ